MQKFKRNDVVMYRVFYGRVNRRIDENHVEMIDTGQNMRICRDDELTDCSRYNGYLDGVQRGIATNDPRVKFPIFRRMPSLRRLKQRASEYDKTVWKQYRDKN